MYATIPRVACEYPMGFDFPAGAEIPVRARDDLDPHSPPLEYASGRISWDGHASREARDAARLDADRAAGVARVAEERQARDRRISALRDRRTALKQSVAACPGHVVLRTSAPRPFAGPVSEPRPGSKHNPAAHGNIEVTQTCRCGAERTALLNGCHEEHSGWTRHYAAIDTEIAALEDE